MANVITQFLIGIGYDYDDKGERQAKAGMESIKSSTLAIGSALASAAIGAGVKVDQLAEKSRKLQDQLYRTNTPTTWVQGYGAAMTELGGNADDAAGRVTDLEQQLAAIKMGDRGFLDSLGQAGFDAGDLAQAKSAQDFITRASDQFSRATHTQQVNMGKVLGLTDSEFKLWQQGGRYVDEHSEKLAEQLGYTESLNQKQYEYSQSWVELNLELDKAGNTISKVMLPGMTSLVNRAKDFVGTINTFAGENPEATKTAVGVGTGAAVFAGAKLLSRVPGLGAVGGVAGPAAAVVGGGIAANEGWDSIMQYSDQEYGKETTGGGNFKANSPLGKIYNWGTGLFEDEPTEKNPQRPLYEKSESPTRSVAPSGPETIYPLSYWEKPTQGREYSPQMMSVPTNDYQQQNEHLARTLREAPIQVQNKVDLKARVELDGRQVGQIIDDHIDEHNRQSMVQFDTQVDR